MSLDLILGFKEKPLDLDNTLRELGFEKLKNSYKLEVGAQIRPLEFIHYPSESPTSWKGLGDNTVTYEGLVISRGSGEATTKLFEIARNLRDRYKALLLNPQTDQIITD